MNIRVALGPRAGLSAEEITFIRSGRQGSAPATFGVRERLVMEYADQLTRTGTTTTEMDSRIRDAFDTPRQIVELAAVVAIANASARLESALKVQED